MVHRVAQRVAGDEGLFLVPVVVEGGAEQDAKTQVYVHQVRRDQLAVNYYPRVTNDPLPASFMPS